MPNWSQSVTRIADQLNVLLTEPPHETPTGPDLGLFCREHAFCTCVIAAIQGVPLQLASGDITVANEFGCGFTSVGEPDGHTWCMAGSGGIVDLSLNLKFYPHLAQLPSPISAFGINGRYEVCQVDTASMQEVGSARRGVIAYTVTRLHEISPLDLLDDPLALLPNRQSAEISMAVALHVARVVSGSTSPLSRSLPQNIALRSILGRDDQPKRHLKRLLRQTST